MFKKSLQSLFRILHPACVLVLVGSLRFTLTGYKIVAKAFRNYQLFRVTQNSRDLCSASEQINPRSKLFGSALISRACFSRARL